MNGHTGRLIWRQMNVQLRVRTFDMLSLSLLVFQPAIFSAVGMVLSRVAGNSQPDLVYTVIGGGIMGMWSGLVFTSTFDIRGDRRDGTLELIVASPTSLGTVESIRTMTNVLAGLLSMSVAFIAALLIFHYSLADANLLAAIVSFLLILLGMWALGIFFANFLVWSRLSGSMVEFLEMPVAIVCGFMYPIQILPQWMQSISVIFPIRWALEAMNSALTGTGDLHSYSIQWALSLFTTLILWLVTRWLDGKVHDRIRVTGEMSSI
ncbi:MAG: ABC transporter permease [Anaerolineales bacterium]|nr:ABC transporter permease [Anaerolineales bacterium]